MPSTQPEFRSCFVSAPIGTELKSLYELLAEYNIQALNLSTFGPGDSLTDSITESLKQADFVICCLPKDSSLASVYFEVGIACGIGKPILLIVDPSVTTPQSLDSFHRARAESDDVRALRFHLKAFLKHHRKSKGIGTRATRVKPLDMTDLRQRLAILKEMPSKIGAEKLENLIATVFERIGSQTSEPVTSDDSFDLAVWIDEVEPVIPNPILIETRWRIHTGSQQRNLEAQFQRQLSKVRALLGLIVYLHHDSTRQIDNTVNWPLIIYLPVEELIDLAETGQLAKKLIRERNARVHLGRPSN